MRARKLLAAGAVVLSGLVLGMPAGAQDASLAPSFANLSLSSGFVPDPATVQVVAGGSVDASYLGNGCNGMIANAPDVKLSWRNDGGSRLTIMAVSGGDTTLVINMPDGSWLCDDDSGGDLDPAVVIRNAPSGVYDIWVGTIGDGDGRAILSISEL
ncbi:MAG: peptidase S1 [Hyphomonadaceae bacterium]|nr:peptidase S1 [Hyphomonadaceae bacterium]